MYYNTAHFSLKRELGVWYINTFHLMETIFGNLYVLKNWNYLWNLYVFKFFGIYMFFKFLRNHMFTKNWSLYFFYKVVQATVYAIASYDGAASILGSARVLRTPTKRSKVALLIVKTLSRGWRIRSRQRNPVSGGKSESVAMRSIA